MVERIIHTSQLYAIVIRRNYHAESIEFFTPANSPQQLGYMNRPKGYYIKPHVHNPVERVISLTQEVLVIKSGKIRVDFYDTSKTYLKSISLEAGDVIFLSNGGHGFAILEDAEVIEIKQGPFVGERDKIRFEPIGDNEVQLLDGRPETHI